LLKQGVGATSHEGLAGFAQLRRPPMQVWKGALVRDETGTFPEWLGRNS
jgi:hypothetical protein